MSALEIGCKAPDFTAETTQGTLSLSDLLAASSRGVARGQSMVVYRGTRVLGEGTIDSTGR